VKRHWDQHGIPQHPHRWWFRLKWLQASRRTIRKAHDQAGDSLVGTDRLERESGIHDVSRLGQSLAV